MKNLLIVDDEKLILMSLERCMKLYGYSYNVHTAENGREAVGILERNDIDVLITDLNMPVMNGFELLEYVSVSRPGLPAVVMTAALTEELQQRLSGLGVTDCLEKPFEMKTLCSRVSSLLGSRLMDGEPVFAVR